MTQATQDRIAQEYLTRLGKTHAVLVDKSKKHPRYLYGIDRNHKPLFTYDIKLAQKFSVASGKVLEVFIQRFHELHGQQLHRLPQLQEAYTAAGSRV